MENNEKKLRRRKIFMYILAVTNIILYFYLPLFRSPFDLTVHGSHDLGAVFVLFIMLPATIIYYLPVTIVGTVSLCSVVADCIRAGKFDEQVRLPVCLSLFSFLLVTFGTFCNGAIREWLFKKVMESDCILMLKGGLDIPDYCINWGDTLIDRNHNDTLVIDNSTNTAHWTYKPGVDYEIILDRRSKYPQSPRNMSFAPKDNKIGYICKCVNNKNVDDFYVDEDAYRGYFHNQDVLCYIVSNERDYGFVLFDVQGGKAVLRDSCSNIYGTFSSSHRDRLLPYFCSPILRYPLILFESNGGACYDVFDVSRKKFLLTDFPYDFRDEFGDTIMSEETYFDNRCAWYFDEDKDTVSYFTARRLYVGDSLIYYDTARAGILIRTPDNNIIDSVYIDKPRNFFW